MARKKQKLINYHSGLILSAQTQTEAAIAGNLSYGEITVIHAPEQPLIGTKTGDNTVAWFMSSGQVETSIHNAITGATGDITQLQTDVRNLSSATDTYINTTAPQTYLTMSSAATTYYTSGQVETTYLKKEDAANTYLTMSSAASTYATSGDVVNALNSISGSVDSLASTVGEHTTAINDLTTGLSATVVSQYATKTYADNTAKAASATAYTSAVTYIDNTLKDYAYSSITHTEIEAEKSRAEGIEGALRTDVDTLSGYMETITEEGGLSATVIADHAIVTAITTTYETKEDANTKYTSAITYVNTASGNIENHLHTTYWTSAETQNKLNTITQDISNVSAGVISTSAAVKTLSGDVVNYVNLKVANVYRYKGSVTNYSDLSGITDKENGDVYNVVNANGNIGESGYTPAGTNYAWNEEAEAWDALGGTIDLSTYATKSDVSGITNSLHNEVVELQTATGNLNTNINYVSGQVDTLSGKVVSDYYTKTDSDGKFLTMTSAATTYYTSGQVETTYLKKADAQNTYLTITSASSIVTAITTDISSLSSATQTIETKANNSISAVTTAEVTTPDNTTNTDYASGVKIDTDNAGRVTKFDFSELVIDCGEYGNE